MESRFSQGLSNYFFGHWILHSRDFSLLEGGGGKLWSGLQRLSGGYEQERTCKMPPGQNDSGDHFVSLG